MKWDFSDIHNEHSLDIVVISTNAKKLDQLPILHKKHVILVMIVYNKIMILKKNYN